MDILLIILWVIWGYTTIFPTYAMTCILGVAICFPEGKRWWHLPMYVAFLINFSMWVMLNPWGWSL